MDPGLVLSGMTLALLDVALKAGGWAHLCRVDSLTTSSALCILRGT